MIPNPWDIGTARIMEKLGFEALATTSAGLAFSLGMREGTVTPAQLLDHCRALVNATQVPVSADLEKGFGDHPDDVAATIRQAAATGIAGGSIEDFTGDTDDPIFDFSLAVERVQAGVQAARNLTDDFVFTARAENFLYGRPDLDDTIKRLQAFEAAGADCVYAPGLRSLDEIKMVCSAVTVPVNVIMGNPALALSVDDLAEVGVKRISVGSALARHVFGAFVDATREISQTGTFSFGQKMISFGEMDDFFKS